MAAVLPLSSRIARPTDPGELTVTIDSIPPGGLTVLPVTDYEPPVRAVPRRRVSGPVRRRAGKPPRSAPPRVAALPPVLQNAAAFSATALRRVLEVIDRRRPAAALHPLLAAGLVDSVLSGRPADASARGAAATLQRVRVQAVESGDPPAAEVFGSYRRGSRTHALACRIESVQARAGWRWQVVALHIG